MNSYIRRPKLTAIATSLTICATAAAGVGCCYSALAGEMRRIAREENRPTQNSVRSILQDKIDELETRKTVLEATQQRDPVRFTDAMAIELASIKLRLEKLREALGK